MDHGSHEMGGRPEATNQAQGLSSSVSMGMHSPMQMYFSNSSEVTILFKSWSVETRATYALVCLCVIVSGATAVFLKLLRQKVDRWALKRLESVSALPPGDEQVATLDGRPLVNRSRVVRKSGKLEYNLVKAGTAAVVVTWDYLLMLIAMTFNIGLFLSIVLGVAIGFALLAHKFHGEGAGVERGNSGSTGLESQGEKAPKSALEEMCCIV